jgi:hypothetical protein
MLSMLLAVFAGSTPAAEAPALPSRATHIAEFVSPGWTVELRHFDRRQPRHRRLGHLGNAAEIAPP